jgi:hypothetical protein
MTVSPTIRRIGEAIATAEGFYVEGSRPARNHNPGDLTLDLTGKAVGQDGAFVVYGSDVDGFQALYTQVGLMVSGLSEHYNPSMTISQIAQRYSPDGWQAWASNVAGYLGVDVDTPLGDIAL